MDSLFHSTHAVREHVHERVDASCDAAQVRTPEGFGSPLFSAWARSLSSGGGCPALIGMHLSHTRTSASHRL